MTALDTHFPTNAPEAYAQPVTALIQADSLSLRYGKKAAFADVSLGMSAGEITAIVGPSGCGKSSFLMCLNRLTDLVPEAEISGQLRWGDWDLLHPKLDTTSLRRRVGMILQKPNPFPLSIWKNLAFPLAEHGIKQRGEQRQRIEQALQEVGLWNEVKDRLKDSALQLSGGQQQRLCIARALVLQPEVLLMDEPCSALDPISSRRVEELVRGMRGRYTVAIVTHNLAQAKRLADQTAVFWTEEGGGHLIEMGATGQIFEQPQHPLTQDYVSGVQG